MKKIAFCLVSVLSVFCYPSDYLLICPDQSIHIEMKQVSSGNFFNRKRSLSVIDYKFGTTQNDPSKKVSVYSVHDTYEGNYTYFQFDLFQLYIDSLHELEKEITGSYDAYIDRGDILDFYDARSKDVIFKCHIK